MSRSLSELLGANEISFRLSIQQLEKASGNPAADIRLVADIVQQALQKIKHLGLDAKDTTAHELYATLLERVRSDDERLEGALGHQKENNTITPHSIISAINALSIPRSCFAIKLSVAKRLLKVNPPKITSKRLGYRSIDSLLKREPIAAIFIAASYIEPTAWQKKMSDQYKKLQPSDFETRDMDIFASKGAKWDEVVTNIATKQHQPILFNKELGGIIILPLLKSIPASTTATLYSVLQVMNDIRIHSVYCKLQQVKSNFGEIIADSIKGSTRNLVLVAGQALPWYVIQKHYSHYANDFPLELFEPHVHQEDLRLIQVEDVLSYIEPTLDFWQSNNFLGHSDKGSVVSLNLLDVAINCCNQIPFGQRIVSHFRDNLWTELLLRYLQQEELERAVVRQLDAHLVEGGSEPALSASYA